MANPTMDKASSAAQNFGSQAKDLEQNIHKFSRETGEKAGELASQVANSTSQWVKQGSTFVKANPVRGAAYAAGAGLVLGSLLTLIFRGKK